jgi:Flp pilus assembly protein CpaB
VGNRFSGLFKTRRGALIISGVAALLAALLLIVYLRSYRSSVNAGARPERVLVAKRLITRGTAGLTIAQKGLYEITTVQKDQLEPFAIADPSAINGRVAAGDIYPGQQLTQADFTTENADTIPYEITGAERAIAVPVDGVHGLIGEVLTGDYVDVYVGIAGISGGSTSASAATSTQVRLLKPDILVLNAPGAAASSAADVVLRVSVNNTAEFAYAADYERIWLVLRPQVGASKTPAAAATLATLLAGAG